MRIVAFLLFAVVGTAGAEERIVAFDSTLSIQADATVLVTERIAVTVENDKIKRGIFRDFPTDYRDHHGQRVRVGFEVLGVQRDGAGEPWFTERQPNGVRLYIGDKDVTIPPGPHRYEIRYRTTRQVGFFAGHDELYWNVTGNGWILPIEAASADLTLPREVPAAQLRLEGWTGPVGSKVRGVAATLRDGGGSIRATRGLDVEEGLTIAFTFPKGIVAEPSLAQRARWWAQDNRGLLVAIVGFLLVWCWFLWRWWKYGRDPDPGVVIPEYEAPEGLPPSTLRYVRDMQYHGSLFTADLMHLAERGVLRIEHDKQFEFTKLRDADWSNPVARAVLRLMFAKGDRVQLDSRAYRVMAPARAMHRQVVVESGAGRWFHRNAWSLVIGMVASAILGAAGMIMQSDGGEAVAGIFCAAALAIAAAVFVGRVRRVLNGSGWARVGSAIVALVALAGCAAAGLALAVLTGTVLFAVIAGLALTNALFAHLLPAYTPEGRRLLDRIEGFTRYLSVAEKDDLARQQAPPMSGERFAQFLPYAMALGVEKAWAGKLEAALGEAQAIEATRAAVGPWYVSSRGTDFTPIAFASAVGSSFGSAISSAATPPGRSSGGGYSGGGGGYSSGGGGGSSGGGGGGGGGGGW